MQLTELPTEILLQIASHLEHRSIVLLQSIGNSRLLAVLTPVVWQSISLRGETPYNDMMSMMMRYPYWETRHIRPKGFDVSLLAPIPNRILSTSCPPRSRSPTILTLVQHCRAQLRHVRRVLFINTFFEAQVPPCGTAITHVVTLLRAMSGLKTITLLLGPQYKRDLHIHWRSMSNDPPQSPAIKHMHIHPLLRWDVWMQPFLDVYSGRRDVEFEVHTVTGIYSLRHSKYDPPGRVWLDSGFHAAHKLSGRVPLRLLHTALDNHRTANCEGGSGIEDRTTTAFPQMLAENVNTLTTLDLQPSGATLLLDPLLTRRLHTLKLARCTLQCTPATDFSHLRRLEVSHCTVADPYFVHALLRHAQRLHTLRLANCLPVGLHVTDADNYTLISAAHFPALVYLFQSDHHPHPKAASYTVPQEAPTHLPNGIPSWATLLPASALPALQTLTLTATSHAIPAPHAALTTFTISAIELPSTSTDFRAALAALPALQTLTVPVRKDSRFKLSRAFLTATLLGRGAHFALHITGLEIDTGGTFGCDNVYDALAWMWDGPGTREAHDWMIAHAKYNPWVWREWDLVQFRRREWWWEWWGEDWEAEDCACGR
ncbi:hypothetical protein EDC01DRAFT_679412 [Geopyxis carbonaria]|nr:hypothetical protein EDC01DRAFT_679412 [Geopyxis carbonaria]